MATYGLDNVNRAPRRASVGSMHTATDGRDILVNRPDGWEVDRPWLWLDGPADGDGTGGPFGNPPPGALMGPAGYLAIPTFLQCTYLISEQIAAMPWQVFRDNMKINVPGWISDPQGARLDGRVVTLDAPIPRLSAPEFWSQVITSLLWYGEAFIYTPRKADGSVGSPIWLLHPEDVELELGRFFVPSDDGPAYIDPSELLVIRGHMRPGKSRGYGVVNSFRESFRLAGALRVFASNTFRRGIPAGYLKVNQPDLTPEQAAKLKTRWLEQHGGGIKSIAVLNSVTEFHPLALDTQTEQMIDMLRLSAWEICSMFGVPVSKVGLSVGDSMTYNNAQDDDQRFVKDTLRTWVNRVEAAISNWLPAGQYMRVNLNSYLRANTTDRFEAYSKALDPETGFMTVDEVRALEDLPPMTVGEHPGTVPPSSDAASAVAAVAAAVSGEAAADPERMKAAFDALGTAIRAGVVPESAAALLGLEGIQFTGAVPVSLRLPESDAQQLEGK